MIDLSMAGKLKLLETTLKLKIKGQDHVIPEIVQVLQNGEFGLKSKDRPKGSFLFLGPTGVGKTEITLTFSDYLFGKGKLHRFDMSEFMHFDSVKEFRGDEAGHIGRLEEVLKKYDDGVLLFDEMEKADKRILDLFLQILDTATVTLARGAKYNLSNFYIVFTSNIGSGRIKDSKYLTYGRIKKAIMLELKSVLRPEFVARISNICVFRKLEYDTQKEIAQSMLNSEISRIKLLGQNISYDSTLLNYVIRNGIDRNMGARPLRNCIETTVQTAVSNRLLNGFSADGMIKADLKNNKVVIANI
ncbi:MAG TPA: ATP-dependent Clp protease ATP-binding subunit [Lentisphaeria bacterium]|nr:MAG: hypothetical protein A2X47_11705 [Lentisphaerae bacterium GWF2_38_69]HBM17284.1 ATP-dependent Clp protease ATP-binding subunit [Lentisphaeria bacterium]